MVLWWGVGDFGELKIEILINKTDCHDMCVSGGLKVIFC